MKKKVWVVSPLFYFMAAALAVMGIIMFRYDKLIAAIELTVAFLAICGVVTSDIILRQNIKLVSASAKKVLEVRDDESALINFALPIAVVGEGDDIIWCNNTFKKSFCGGKEAAGDSILGFIFPRTILQIESNDGTPIKHRGSEYTVYSSRTDNGRVLVFVDDTDYKFVSREFREKKPVVCLAVFDNREEIIRVSVGGEDSRISAEVDSLVRDWGYNELGGFSRKLQSGRYLIITDERHLEEEKQKRFPILDKVREIKTVNKMSATISIGVGRSADSLGESDRWARQALDMALGRGGDQVAVLRQNDVYEFFGGMSKGVEKRDKVRTRVIAASISDFVRASDRVYIMGHMNSDLDSMGAAVGMWAVITKGLEKRAQIVVNKSQTMAEQLIESLETAYPDRKIFIGPMEALQEATDNTLLIVVDTHSINFVESRELVDRLKKRIIIDHHRLMVTRIRDTDIFYHEPYASSASEMVTEIVQYINSSAIDSIDAQALLSGIMLDTKSFVLKTGVRTFEASAFLRRCGADTVEVKKLFSNTLETYKEKAQLVSGAEIYKDCAIASTSWESEGMRVTASQAADELLTIEGVRASFVLYKNGEDVNFSARSLGEVNVQVILEEFGGGGHFTMSGAQIKNISMGEARRLLIRELDKKLPEDEAAVMAE